MNAQEIVKALGGRGGMARCPSHPDRTPSLAIRTGGDGRLLVHCFSGCPQDAVIAKLRALGLWPGRTEHSPARRPAPRIHPPAPVYRHTDESPKETQRACDIWRRFCGILGPGNPAGRYLIGRGIPRPWPETLAEGRLHHPETGEADVPALIVARHCPTVGLVRGIQRIFLTEDGRKYAHGTAKMSLGSITDGRAELVTPDTDLLLSEGVESALSAWRLFRVAAWAFCGSFPRTVKLPDRVRKVIVVADHDEHGVSQRQAKALAQTIRATGRTCTVAMPAGPGQDANDIARELRHAG